jgi:hypothetical protein
MAKGFVYTLDAVFAAITLSLFTAAFFFLSSQSEHDNFPSLALSHSASDSLAMLDKSGLLGSQNSTAINASLSSSFPSAVSYSLQLEYYNYTNSSGFVRDGNLSLGASAPDGAQVSTSQREFLSISNKTVQKYGVARLKLWVG